MAYRLLYINFIGAKGLKNIRHFRSKMCVYAVVFVPGSRNNQQYRTPVDIEGHQNPDGNCEIKFTFDTANDQNRLILVFKLYCKRSRGDREIGEFRVPLTELLSGEQVEQFRECKAGTPSGEQLNFSYKVANTDEPQLGHWHPPGQAQNSGKSKTKKVFAAMGAMGTVIVTNVVATFLGAELISEIHNDSEIPESDYETSEPDYGYGT